MEDAIPPSTSQFHPQVSVAKARDLIAQARSKSAPHNRGYSLSKIQRQHHLNESILRTLVELNTISHRLNDPLQRLHDYYPRTALPSADATGEALGLGEDGVECELLSSGAFSEDS